MGALSLSRRSQASDDGFSISSFETIGSLSLSLFFADLIIGWEIQLNFSRTTTPLCHFLLFIVLGNPFGDLWDSKNALSINIIYTHTTLSLTFIRHDGKSAVERNVKLFFFYFKHFEI